MSKVTAFLKDESGATAIEYGLIAAGISVVIIATVNAIGSSLNAKFDYIANSAEVILLRGCKVKAAGAAGGFSFWRMPNRAHVPPGRLRYRGQFLRRCRQPGRQAREQCSD